MDPGPETVFGIFGPKVADLASRTRLDGSGTLFCSGLVVSETGLMVSEAGLMVSEAGLVVPDPGLVVSDLKKKPPGIEPSPGLWQFSFLFFRQKMKYFWKKRDFW